MSKYVDAGLMISMAQEKYSSPDATAIDQYDAIAVIRAIEKMPPADVAPVRHGAWKEERKWVDGFGTWVTDRTCSECGHLIRRQTVVVAPRFCEDCGALMNGGEKDG